MRVLSQNSEQRSAVADINSMLSRIRTEVAARRIGVTACASADQASCSGTPNWEQGWVIFTDRNANGAIDTNDAIIQVHGALANGATLRLGTSSSITFNSSGQPAAGATFRYCDGRGLSSLRAIIVGQSGMIRPSSNGRDHADAEISTCT